MPVMTEEQFSHLEAMIKAIVVTHVKALEAHNERDQFSHYAALEAADLEHTVRKAAKEALTK